MPCARARLCAVGVCVAHAFVGVGVRGCTHAVAFVCKLKYTSLVHKWKL